MMLQFQKATKAQSKLRLAVFGPSGSGKTFTSLRMATGIGGNIALIDTERGSASLYADRFDFSVLELPERNIETYVAAIKAAQDAGFNVLIIDSLTHAWHELLDEIERIARARYGGNTWSAWSEGTPRQRALVDALLDFDGHIIATMRTKTEWAVQQNQKGKNTPIRVGLAPEQGKGIEYEFTLLMEMTTDHIGSVIKDRTGKYQDKTIDKPGEDFGAALAAWLADGVEIRNAHWSDDNENVEYVIAWAEKIGLTREAVYAMIPREEWPQYESGKLLCHEIKTMAEFAAEQAEKADVPSVPDLRTPEQVKGWVVGMASAYEDAKTEASDGQRGLTVATLEGLFPNEPKDMQKQCRYSLLKFFWGVDSITKCSDAQVLAMLDWAGTEGATGKTIPDPSVFGEAARIILELGEAAGQQSLV